MHARHFEVQYFKSNVRIAFIRHVSLFPSLQVYLRFNVTLAVHGTSQIFSETVLVAPEPPELQIEAPQQLQIGHEENVLVRFKNPLPVKMEGVTINVESDELLHGMLCHVIVM